MATPSWGSRRSTSGSRPHRFGSSDPRSSRRACRAPQTDLVVLAVTFLVGRRGFGAQTGLVGALFAATTVLGLGSALSLTDMSPAACVARGARASIGGTGP